MILIDIKYKIGEIVYLVTDEQQRKRIVTGFLITIKEVMYQVSYDDYDPKYFYDFELSREKEIL